MENEEWNQVPIRGHGLPVWNCGPESCFLKGEDTMQHLVTGSLICCNSTLLNQKRFRPELRQFSFQASVVKNQTIPKSPLKKKNPGKFPEQWRRTTKAWYADSRHRVSVQTLDWLIYYTFPAFTSWENVHPHQSFKRIYSERCTDMQATVKYVSKPG